MLNSISHKKERILFVSIFVLIYFLYTNSEWQFKSIIIFNPVFEFNLSGFLYDILKLSVLITPFVVSAILLVTTIFYFSNLIKSPNIRKYVKIFSFIILIAGIYLIGTEIVQPPDFSPQITDQTTTTTSTTTSTTPTTSAESSTSITETTSTNPFSLTFTPTSNSLPTFIDLDVNQNLINFLLIVFLVIISVIFLRSTRSNNTIINKNEKSDMQLKLITKSDENRIFILKEYLKLSNELELKGINPDFSLTPLEFESEAISGLSGLNLNEMVKITYYYELARFSENEITAKDIKEFNLHLKEIYDKLEFLKINKNEN